LFYNYVVHPYSYLFGRTTKVKISPENLAATMYSLMGINYEKRLMTSDLRPIDIVREGKILTDIIA